MDVVVNKTNWNDLFKVRIRNFSEATDQHDVIKLLIMRKLIRKYHLQKSYIRAYSECPVRSHGENRIADIVFENIKTKAKVAYEIQKDCSEEWMKSTKEFYKDWDTDSSNMFFRTADLIIVNLNDMPDSIVKLNRQLDEVIV